MTHSISRSDFLRGKLTGENRPLRPPWAVSETQFLEVCNQCGNCIDRCPTKIIYRARGRYPAIDFNRGECLFCGDCSAACETGALQQTDSAAAWSLVASIDTRHCLAYQAVECRSCFDPCESRAISMHHQLGAVASPMLDTDRCTGCGACFAPCPVNAIKIQYSMEVAA